MEWFTSVCNMASLQDSSSTLSSTAPVKTTTHGTQIWPCFTCYLMCIGQRNKWLHLSPNLTLSRCFCTQQRQQQQQQWNNNNNNNYSNNNNEKATKEKQQPKQQQQKKSTTNTRTSLAPGYNIRAKRRNRWTNRSFSRRAMSFKLVNIGDKAYLGNSMRHPCNPCQ